METRKNHISFHLVLYLLQLCLILVDSRITVFTELKITELKVPSLKSGIDNERNTIVRYVQFKTY